MPLETSSSLENTTDLEAAGITPVTKKLVFNSLAQATNLPTKIEGIAIMDGKHVVLINDNDFGITGADSVITVLPIADQFK